MSMADIAEGSGSQKERDGGSSHTPAMPPAMAEVKSQSVDDIVRELKRMPLFMTELDEENDEDNPDLEALKALAYEGTRAEIAQNFREQGNDLAKVKRWSDAREYYDKALTALKSDRREDEMDLIEDKLAEARKERDIAEACHVNRALCHLENKNYRSCNIDCAATLRLNPRNIKAWYRSSTACLALDKLAEAEDACSRGLEIESSNSSLVALRQRIKTRKEHLAKVEQQRQARLEHERAVARTLKLALKQRGIKSRSSDKAPDMEDAEMKLETPLDSNSALSLPVILLYSVDLQSDFIKAFQETESLADHLDYILPLPWDKEGRYKIEEIDCYMETIAGGLVKVGKKLPFAKIAAHGKVEVVDGLLKVHVVPKKQASDWIAEFKRRMPG